MFNTHTNLTKYQKLLLIELYLTLFRKELHNSFNVILNFKYVAKDVFNDGSVALGFGTEELKYNNPDEKLLDVKTTKFWYPVDYIIDNSLLEIFIKFSDTLEVGTLYSIDDCLQNAIKLQALRIYDIVWEKK